MIGILMLETPATRDRSRNDVGPIALLAWCRWREIGRENPVAWIEHRAHVGVAILSTPEMKLLVSGARVVLQEHAARADRDVPALPVHLENALSLDVEHGLA